ncbi:HET-domain-containing protein [Athelia psychrophila]|uniref:HET-domain-containing protein n=1 Tax=Athelia psychrophila TaxID=1759441 RepID=A0A166CS95_9AGAM|nr:HET-domain-containing protein [Fibularhizoctonia sp. CBS 109695]
MTESLSSTSLCKDCSSINPQSLILASSLPRAHKPTFKDLKDSAVTCKSCAVMECALPLEASYEGRKHTLTAGTGPVELRGAADKTNGLLSLSSIWVDCLWSHAELSVDNADPNHRVVAGDKIAPDATASYPFIQRQLSICDAEHTDHCSRAISLDPKDRSVPPPRLYNISDRCIQDASKLPTEKLQYIALSYTWGKAVPDSIKTLKENITARQVQNAFDLQNTIGCPTAYRTAIEITQGLGLSYIWIDSICMIQDDDDDRDRHFKRFDEGVGQIYQNAHLTVCATGSDASCNLLGPRKLPDGTKIADIPLDGGQVVISSYAAQLFHYLKAGGNEAMKRGWDSRGWTFQEWLLSPRLAYFTESQVFFECRTLYKEGRGTSFALDNNARYQLRSDDDRERMLELWQTIVIQYSGRFLGHWSDRLNGIRSVGMQLVMRIRKKTGEDIKLCSGLLSERLHISLLWQTSSHAGSKRITAGEWEKEPTPPFWSWACWTGDIIWELHLRTSSRGIEVSSIDDNRVVLLKPELLDCKIGQSLAVGEKSLDLQTYAKEIGSRTCSQGYKMQHWSRMLALLHPEDGSIVGRASFDDPNSKETSVECLVVSHNPSKQNPHTFEETKSMNVLLVRKEKELGYIRLGVGEVFVQTGERKANLPPSKRLDSLVLI